MKTYIDALLAGLVAGIIAAVFLLVLYGWETIIFDIFKL